MICLNPPDFIIDRTRRRPRDLRLIVASFCFGLATAIGVVWWLL